LDYVNSTWVFGDTLYVANGSSGVRAYDISDIQDITYLTDIDTENYAVSVYAYGEYLYINDQYSIAIYDINSPAYPSFVSMVGFDSIENMYGYGESIYVYSNSSGQLSLLDVSDPYNPVLKSTLMLESYYGQMQYINGNIIFSSSDNGLDIIDVSNPENIYLKYSVQLENNYGYTSLYLNDNKLYAASDYFIDIFSLEDMSNIYKITSIYMNTALISMQISENKLYAACGEDGALVFDISDISNPVLISDQVWIKFLSIVEQK